MKHFIKQLTTSQIIILGFAGVILIGSLLLMLPFCTNNHQFTPFLDALFTATSAVCVTGLVVHDTATYWSSAGQFIILCLIQTGGMGVITVALAVYTISGRKIGLKQRSTMQEAISAPYVGGIVRFIDFIIKMMILIEVLGAALMAPVFCRDYGPVKGIWYALFHSISAFCNAGFDLMGTRSPYSSLTHYVNNPVINVTIMSLIIVGGIGFMLWKDVIDNRFHLRRYQMQSKVILLITFFLILLPALYFYHYECANMTGWERFWASVFQSVTPRTAGFNTADLSKFTDTGQLIIIMLMLTGGSPGSTAGGMKTTTLVVLLATALSVFFRRDHTILFGRRVSYETIRRAVTIFMMYLTLFLTGGIIICQVEGLPLLVCLFETASAIGTVGLTVGITPGLGIVSRIILIVLMYTGRVGCLTLVFSAFSANTVSMSRYPQGQITVG